MHYRPGFLKLLETTWW